MKKRLGVFGALLLGSVLASCAFARSEDGPQTSPLRDARLQVVNNGWSEMVIYAERSGNRVRLGSVTSLSRAVLDIPRPVVLPGTSLRFVVSPIGSNAIHFTEPVQVSPGELVAFEIHDNLALSNVTVWAQ